MVGEAAIDLHESPLDHRHLGRVPLGIGPATGALLGGSIGDPAPDRQNMRCTAADALGGERSNVTITAVLAKDRRSMPQQADRIGRPGQRSMCGEQRPPQRICVIEPIEQSITEGFELCRIGVNIEMVARTMHTTMSG